MTRMQRIRAVAGAGLSVTLAVGCGGPTDPDPGGNGNGDAAIASVTVTSPIGDKMARGRQVQLDAAAATADGGTVSTTFSWMSSNDAVASVSGSGLVDGLAPGPATITATAEGVSGDVAITVVDADLDGIEDAVSDAYVERLIAGLPDASATAVQQAMDQCGSAADQGHINNIIACLAAARTAIGTPSTPDETVLFVYLGLYIDHAERLLNL